MSCQLAYSLKKSALFAIATLFIGWGLLSCSPAITDTGVGTGPGNDGSNGPFPDLPGGPVAGGTIKSDKLDAIAAAFSQAKPGLGAGPCLLEPALDAMYPLNFSPPLFEWSAPANQNIFELRLHVDNQISDLVLYTDQSSFVLPDAMWSGLTQHSAGHDITITLRSGQLSGGALVGGAFEGASGPVHIAPVPAPGAVVYWTTSGGSALKGFHIGDRKPTTVLAPQQIRNGTPGGDNTQCIGCHTSSPDGALAFFGRSPNTDAFPFSVDARVLDGSGKRPGAGVVSANALLQLSRTLQFMPTFSPAHYSESDAAVITVGGSYPGPFELIWTDLHATSAGTRAMTRTGDSRDADSPNFSKDGTRVAYTSTDIVAISGQPTYSDIYTIPYNQGAGGNASPVPGASDPKYNEFYPAFSPGDTFLAFNRVPAGQAIYDVAYAELFIVPSQGGQPTRLRANDSPACSGLTSPGITNSYPRWAPTTMPDGADRYYWMVFSSRRRANPLNGVGIPQLFLSVVVTTSTGGVETVKQTYPAIFIPAQLRTESNHTPAWDVFQLPPAG